MTRPQLRSRPMLALSGIGWVILLFLLLGASLPLSRLAINPGAVVVTREGVVLARTFLADWLGLPRPILSYQEVVRPLTVGHNHGHPCEQTGGPRRYANPGSTWAWSLDWAAACTDDPLGFEWSAEWTWHLGALRMTPVRAQAIFLAEY